MRKPTPALFAAVLELIRNARRLRQDHRLLRAMSERELRDLGVGRSEIPALFSDVAATSNGRNSRAPYVADVRPEAPR